MSIGVCGRKHGTVAGSTGAVVSLRRKLLLGMGIIKGNGPGMFLNSIQASRMQERSRRGMICCDTIFAMPNLLIYLFSHSFIFSLFHDALTVTKTNVASKTLERKLVCSNFKVLSRHSLEGSEETTKTKSQAGSIFEP